MTNEQGDAVLDLYEQAIKLCHDWEQLTDEEQAAWKRARKSSGSTQEACEKKVPSEFKEAERGLAHYFTTAIELCVEKDVLIQLLARHLPAGFAEELI